jgi:hypothetical protein
MNELTDEQSLHLSRTVDRLRRVQAQYADRAEDVRHVYLSEELQRAVGKVAPGEQWGFLEQLWANFTDIESAAGESDSEPAWPQHSAQPALAPEAEALAARLVGALARQNVAPAPAAALPVRSSPKAVVTAASEPVLPPAVPPPAFDDTVVRSLCKKLELSEGQTPDPVRVVELAELLIDFALPLYQMTWAAWRTVSPQSSVRRLGNFQRCMAGFVTGGDVSRQQIVAELHRLRQMTAALVSAVGHIGPRLTSEYLSRLLPGEIEQIVATERGSLFQSRAARCWRKYQELSQRLDAATVEGEARRFIAEHVEQLMKGATAPSNACEDPPPRPSKGERVRESNRAR